MIPLLCLRCLSSYSGPESVESREGARQRHALIPPEGGPASERSLGRAGMTTPLPEAGTGTARKELVIAGNPRRRGLERKQYPAPADKVPQPGGSRSVVARTGSLPDPRSGAGTACSHLSAVAGV